MMGHGRQSQTPLAAGEAGGGSAPGRLLRLLAQGGIRSTAELGQELGLSPELVSLMTEGLVQRGYLVAVGANVAEACQGCRLAGVCVGSSHCGSVARPWLTLTEKGRRAAQAIGGGTVSSQ